MNELWYNRPNNLILYMKYIISTIYFYIYGLIYEDNTLPKNKYLYDNLTFNDKINLLATYSILFILFILIFNLDKKFIIISLLILLFTYYIGQNKIKSEEPICVKPSENNPFMNFTYDDMINNPNREEACDYEDVKKDIDTNYRKHINIDKYDLWGKNSSTLNYYTMPNTQIVNDSVGFAKWCYNFDAPNCKSQGNCYQIHDNTHFIKKILNN